MKFSQLTTGSLAQRFTFASATLAAVALLVIALASWWLVSQQHNASMQKLLQKEADLNAVMAGANLSAIASRLSEIADSSILATALVDSAGKETYLQPYLNGIQQINGIPIQIMFVDFEGTEIDRNKEASFGEMELAWLKARLADGKEASIILEDSQGPYLLAVELLTYSRTSSPEGALLYKFNLSDVQKHMTAGLVWDTNVPAATKNSRKMAATLIDTPANFKPLQFHAVSLDAQNLSRHAVTQFIIIATIAIALAGGVLLIGSRLAKTLTKDLRLLERFAANIVHAGFSIERAEVAGSTEVTNLALSINHMLDRLHAQHAQLQLESQEHYRLLSRYRLLVEGTNAISWEATIPNQSYSFVSPQAQQLFGYPQDIWGTSDFWSKHVHPDDLAQAMHHRDDAIKNNSSYRCEYRFRHVDGSYLWIEEIASILASNDGTSPILRGILLDISERKAAEEEIMHLAFYDFLTGLPNRRLLRSRMEQSLAAHSRNKRHGGLLFIDLDNFKILNDTFGHEIGDQLLQQVAQRLKLCVQDGDTLARFGGDEFVVILENLSTVTEKAVTEAAFIGEKILASLNRPYILDGYEYHSSPSIGITMFKEHHHDATEILKQADLALYQAKAAGRNTQRFFDLETQMATNTRFALESDLRQSLHQQDFILHYQPQIDVHGCVVGAEALVRWQHPEHGMIPPAKFIPVAEDTGLILPLGQWVLKTACEQLAAWSRQSETASLDMSVNVSARQFRSPDFVDQVKQILKQTGASPFRLKLELTESLLVEDMKVAIAKMEALKAEGIGFSLDDFGTGYSSLAYLKRLPLDQLKIDSSFVRDVLAKGNDAAIIQTIITLGHSLGLSVIAEGVETEGQRNFLSAHGCNIYQGYLFSRPLPLEQFELFMQESSLIS